jgi:cyclic pyranopterin monophosphate synthase
MTMSEFTHFNPEGRARMVDVGEKESTTRIAVANGRVTVNAQTFTRIAMGDLKKGDVLATAQIGGIMAAKKTSDLIPMCHPLMLNGIDIAFEMDETNYSILITATVKCTGKTGVEMEALTAVSVAALTIYDMCKAIQKDIIIGPIQLVRKTGGKSGTYEASQLITK